MHNYGAAFDAKITRAPAGMSNDSALQQLKMLAPSVGLSSSVPNDPPHFELPISLDEAKSLWASQGNTTPGIQVISTPNVAAASTVAIVVVAILALSYIRRR